MSFIIDPYRFGFTCPDADATAFVLAAGITDDTQKRAICTLVSDLKAYGIWSKMKAIYPFCGSTASQHKFNLKDPRDLDAAFRLVFFGGWTHSSNGALPNGTNAFADTFLIPSSVISSSNSNSLSYYSGSNLSETITDPINMGSMGSTPAESILLLKNNTSLISRLNSNSLIFATSVMRGFFMTSRISSTVTSNFLNGVNVVTGNSGGLLPNVKIILGTLNFPTGPYGSGYVRNDFRFASIGDGLTDTEAANFYISVQKYQTTLGRQVGVPIAVDSDSQAFINAAGITSTIDQNAIITLVSDLKFNGLWTKMRAIYPFIGSTASTQKWNLKDPRDLDAAFRLVFFGGWTHSSNGATPNGTNGYANTFLNPDNTLTLNNTHLSFYSRTNSNGLFCDIGGTDNNVSFLPLFKIIPRYLGDFLGYSYSFQSGQFVQNAVADSNGLMLISRISSTSFKSFKNGNVLGSTTTTQNQTRILGRNVLIGASAAQTISEYSNRQCAFASIGDGLNDTDAANLYNSVQLYETSLNRQV